MTSFWVLDYLCLAVLICAAVLVVFLRNLSASVMALSAMGIALSLLFVVLAAPDVALAEVVVGSIAVPVLYLVAIGKLRTDVQDRGELGEDEDDEHRRSVGASQNGKSQHGESQHGRSRSAKSQDGKSQRGKSHGRRRR